MSVYYILAVFFILCPIIFLSRALKAPDPTFTLIYLYLFHLIGLLMIVFINKEKIKEYFENKREERKRKAIEKKRILEEQNRNRELAYRKAIGKSYMVVDLLKRLDAKGVDKLEKHLNHIAEQRTGIH